MVTAAVRDFQGCAESASGITGGRLHEQGVGVGGAGEDAVGGAVEPNTAGQTQRGRAGFLQSGGDDADQAALQQELGRCCEVGGEALVGVVRSWCLARDSGVGECLAVGVAQGSVVGEV
nr:hypothetical protein [Nocardia farcinica]